MVAFAFLGFRTNVVWYLGRGLYIMFDQYFWGDCVSSNRLDSCRGRNRTCCVDCIGSSGPNPGSRFSCHWYLWEVSCTVRWCVFPHLSCIRIKKGCGSRSNIHIWTGMSKVKRLKYWKIFRDNLFNQSIFFVSISLFLGNRKCSLCNRFWRVYCWCYCRREGRITVDWAPCCCSCHHLFDSDQSGRCEGIYTFYCIRHSSPLT